MDKRNNMDDRLTIKLGENLKCNIKESAEKLDLTPSEFIRVLYLCYKFSNEEDKNSLISKLDENLWSYRAHVERRLIKN